MEMQSQKLHGTKPGPSTQRYLDIAEIREDTVVLKDGNLRVVLAISSVNFGLKSEDEQNATISAYVQFINALEHPVQIVIQSRKLNIGEYLKRLEHAQKDQTNELLRLQIADYRTFVKELVELGEIMSKRFFVVIPYSALSDTRKGFWSRFAELLKPIGTVHLREERFKRDRGALMQRVSHIQGGLSSIGLTSQMLDTQALIELYYKVYNPDVAEIEKLQDVSKIRIEEGLAV